MGEVARCRVLYCRLIYILLINVISGRGEGSGGDGGAVSRKKKKVLQGAATQQVRGTVAAALCFALWAYGSRNLGRV